MTPDPRVIAGLDLPDDLMMTFTVSVGDLRKMLAGANAGRRDLSLEEFAERIKRSVSTARGLCSRKRVPGAYKQNGREWWVPESGLEAYLAAQAEKPQPRATAAPIRLDSWRDEVGTGSRPRRSRA